MLLVTFAAHALSFTAASVVVPAAVVEARSARMIGA